MTTPIQETWQEEFDRKFWGYLDADPEAIKAFIELLLQRKEREVNDRWINQSHNEHDNRIRQETIKRVMEVRPDMWKITRKNFSYDLQEWNNAIEQWTDNINKLK
jgi:hypothetical protein